MAQKICIADLPEFDPAAHLKSEEDVVAYVAAATKENDPVLLALALSDVARARGMGEFVKNPADEI